MCESGAWDAVQGPILHVVYRDHRGDRDLNVEEQGDLLRDLYAVDPPGGQPLAMPYTENEVCAFERRHDLALPGLFRQYLRKVSREAHTNTYRVLLELPMNRIFRESPIPAGVDYFTDQDFPLADDADDDDEGVLNGTIEFGEGGCNYQDYLVLRGPQKGNVIQASNMDRFFVVPLWRELFKPVVYTTR